MLRGVSVRLCVGQRAGPSLSSFICSAVALVLPAWATAAPSTAFYYGPHPPITALAAFDRVVLEPDHVTVDELRALAEARVDAFARLTVGDAGEDRRPQLLEQARALATRGFAGLLLDAIDRPPVEAMLGWLADLRKQLPRCKLLLRGGLALFPRAHGLADGLVVGPLFSGWDPGARRFVEVSASDRQALLDRVATVRGGRDLPVTVIDSVPVGDRPRTRAVAARIAALGFSPWVAPPELDQLGVGPVEAVPRRVLVVFDSTEAPLAHSPAHRLMAVPLEYLGLAVDYLDATGPLPPGRLSERYVGVVSLFTDDTLADPKRYRDWLVHQLDDGLHLVIVGKPGFAMDAALLARLGLQLEGGGVWDGTVKITRRDAVVGFEAAPITTVREMLALRTGPGAPGMQVDLELTDARGGRAHPVLTAPWGGLALDPFVVETGLEDRTRWVLEPFIFLTRALAIPAMPMLDIATENGLRIFTSHIDGDGFVSASETPHRKLASEVILEEILLRYPVPTTVSVIEGEVGAAGLYRHLTPKLEQIARQMFRLPYIEAASHAYSHPFDWEAAEHGIAAKAHDAAHMPIPGYTFNLEREIAGSVAYIDRRLLPAGKRTRVFLWSGSALPTGNAVAATRRLGLPNVNGGSSGAGGQGIASLTNVTCMARPTEGGYQVYAPHQNENNFTNLWKGPFYGYRRVIEVFAQTEQPRRLKPISIYYHFYSGSKPAALMALREIHDWSLAQEIIPIWLSDYARKVEEFQRATLARTLDGGWEMRGLASLRTVRFDERLGWPDLPASPDVTVVRAIPQGRYASFGTGERVRMRFRVEPPQVPYLVWTNGQVQQQQRQGGVLKLRLAGEVALRAAVAGCAGGAPKVTARKVQVSRVEARPEQTELSWKSKESGDVLVSCS